MSLKVKLYIALAAIAVIAYGLFQMEFVQKKVFDIKADITGSDRIVTFYAKMTGEKVKSFQDKDTRYTKEQDGSLTVWLGSTKIKVNSNMDYIIEDR